MASMTDWLSGMAPAEVAALLARRPGALARPQPRTVAELSERLGRAGSLAAMLQDLPAPAVQLAEAIGALGQSPTIGELAAFVGGDAAATERWVAVLTAHAIVWPGADESLNYPEALPGLFGAPLGLGPPLRTLIAGATVDQLRRILSALGAHKPPTRRAEVVVAVERALSDPAVVRRAVDLAPPAIAGEVRAWALAGTEASEEELVAYDPESYRRRRDAEAWASARGLVFRQPWGSDRSMPAEVARALRGPDYHAPFDPDPPEVPVTAVAQAAVADQAARSVSQFADLVLALVDRLARSPIPALKSGGVGVREIDRLCKNLGCSEPELRLALELCAAVGVIEGAGRAWGPGGAAAAWRESAPAERMAVLLQRWWTLPTTPGDAVDEDGKRAPALTPRTCRGCVLARRTVITELANVPQGDAPDPAALCLRARWSRPFAHTLAQDEQRGDGIYFATHLAEAAALGMVAAGALTGIGAAVLAGDDGALRRELTAALPASSESALFGPDLTAVVAGAPSAAVSRLLDSTADRESRGGATVWRFSPGSVRRALDSGASAQPLLADLAAIATGELPQPLRYLIDDIARQHGHLRVSGAASVIRGLDEALLATVAADRALRTLGLRRVAPTALAADADPQAVLAGLRAAGYLPMPDGQTPQQPAGADRAPVEQAQPAGLDANDRAKLLRAIHGDRPRPVPAKLLDADALAARLLASDPGEAPPEGPTEQQLRRARALSPDEIRMLAGAIDASAPVGIDYLSQSGSQSHRVISNPQLFGDSIVAFCELRRAERWFRLDRIQAVFPPEAG